MCAERRRARKGRPRQSIPEPLPDDLFDYADDPTPDGRTRASDAPLLGPDGQRMRVTDDWPENIPVTEAEIDVGAFLFGFFGANIYDAGISGCIKTCRRMFHQLNRLHLRTAHSTQHGCQISTTYIGHLSIDHHQYIGASTQGNIAIFIDRYAWCSFQYFQNTAAGCVDTTLNIYNRFSVHLFDQWLFCRYRYFSK